MIERLSATIVYGHNLGLSVCLSCGNLDSIYCSRDWHTGSDAVAMHMSFHNTTGIEDSVATTSMVRQHSMSSSIS